jgi:hypothetical protein
MRRLYMLDTLGFSRVEILRQQRQYPGKAIWATSVIGVPRRLVVM